MILVMPVFWSRPDQLWDSLYRSSYRLARNKASFLARYFRIYVRNES